MTIHEVNLAYYEFLKFEKTKRDEFWYMTRRLEYRQYLSTPIKGNHKSIDSYWPDWNSEKAKIPSKEERMKRYEKLMN